MTEHVHTFEVEPKSGIRLCTDPTCRQMERKPKLDTGDVAALREALERARAFIDACAVEGEITPNDEAENPCELVDAMDAALSKPNAPGAV